MNKLKQILSIFNSYRFIELFKNKSVFGADSIGINIFARTIFGANEFEKNKSRANDFGEVNNRANNGANNGANNEADNRANKFASKTLEQNIAYENEFVKSYYNTFNYYKSQNIEIYKQYKEQKDFNLYKVIKPLINSKKVDIFNNRKDIFKNYEQQKNMKNALSADIRYKSDENNFVDTYLGNEVYNKVNNEAYTGIDLENRAAGYENSENSANNNNADIKNIIFEIEKYLNEEKNASAMGVYI